MYRAWNYVTNYSILLIAGALIALVWANIDPQSYHHLVEYPLWFNSLVGTETAYWLKNHGADFNITEVGDVTRVLSVHYLVNYILMAFFFAIAAKEAVSYTHLTLPTIYSV